MLSGKIPGTVSSRRVNQEISEQGISPVNLTGAMFKTALIAIFFSVDISYGDQRIAEERRTAEICKTGRDSGNKGYLPILEHTRGFHQPSPDLNWFRKKITKADLAGKGFRGGYIGVRIRDCDSNYWNFLSYKVTILYGD
ncbi:MAG: hypothetical protein ACXQTD_06940, partial [Candidatus Syntropharchaeia archaeon]